jgi:hypothetical protein
MKRIITALILLIVMVSSSASAKEDTAVQGWGLLTCDLFDKVKVSRARSVDGVQELSLELEIWINGFVSGLNAARLNTDKRTVDLDLVLGEINDPIRFIHTWCRFYKDRHNTTVLWREVLRVYEMWSKVK